MKAIKSLLAAVVFVAVAWSAEAAPSAKAVVTDGGKTLRFVCDDVDHSARGETWYRISAAEAQSPDADAPWSRHARTVTKVVFDVSFGTCRTRHCGHWFAGFANLRGIEGLGNLDTSAAVSLAAMFRECASLEVLDLSGFDTAAVTDMREMFRDCSALERIDVSYWFQTKRVTASARMFDGCHNLRGGNWTTYGESRPKDATYARVDGGPDSDTPGYFTMTWSAKALVEDGGETLRFVYDDATCYGAKDEGWFLVAEAERMEASEEPPWQACGSRIRTVTFDASFKTYRPRGCEKWFRGFSVLTALRGMDNLNTSVATSMKCMFSACGSLAALDLSGFDTSKVTDMEGMFHSCGNLAAVYVSDGFVVSQVTASDDMFYGCRLLVGGWGGMSSLPNHCYDKKYTGKAYARMDGDTAAPGRFTPVPKAIVEDGGQTLRFACDGVSSGVRGEDWYPVLEAETIDPRREDVPWHGIAGTVTAVLFDESFAQYVPAQCGRWFYGFSSLISVGGIENLDTSAATSFCRMFTNCRSLETLDLSGLGTSSVTNAYQMFMMCSALREIKVTEAFDLSGVAESAQMFEDCVALVGGRGTAYDETRTDNACACADGWDGRPGYFTDGCPPAAGSYGIRFLPGGGAGRMSRQTCAEVRVYGLRKCAFSRDGRTFAGWACSNGRRYDDGVLVFGLAASGETITMTAIWE